MSAISAKQTLRAILSAALGFFFAIVLPGCGSEKSDRIQSDRLVAKSGDYRGSSSCQPCHAEQWKSWKATHHAAMTQRPSEGSVQGAFDGRRVDYQGWSARPFRAGGDWKMEIPKNEGGSREATVALTVGSRRYQQYFESENRGGTEAYVRLPILWHNEEQRWLPLSTVFVDQDSPDFAAHRATWNENCIFCHNTAPAPGMVNYRDRSRLEGGRFESHVAELGISCEACHGPGALHVQSESDRAAHRATASVESGEKKNLIVHPLKLDKQKSTDVCGQCHGARIPKPVSLIETWLTRGPTFRPEASLADHVEPIRSETPPLGQADPGLFRARFWADGTPRLTAYEYQGLTSSACFLRGELRCTSCHSMHESDPKGQMRKDRSLNGLCTDCHQEIGANLSAHTRHGATSPGSSCVECHMPRIVYGVLDIHRSHRIEIPSAARDANSRRPHACTLCHLDRSLEWADRELSRLFGKPPSARLSRADGAPIGLSDSVASLLAGDPVQRAVYARAAGFDDRSVKPEDSAALRIHLVVTLGDGYPSVRLQALRSLRALERRKSLNLEDDLTVFDHLAPGNARRQKIFELLKKIEERAPGKMREPPSGMFVDRLFRLDLKSVTKLTDLQAQSVIAIGE